MVRGLGHLVIRLFGILKLLVHLESLFWSFSHFGHFGHWVNFQLLELLNKVLVTRFFGVFRHLEINLFV